MGTKERTVFKRLGIKEIPAMVLDEVSIKDEGMTCCTDGNIARRDMNRTDIFNAIKHIWIQFGDERVCADEIRYLFG